MPEWIPEVNQPSEEYRKYIISSALFTPLRFKVTGTGEPAGASVGGVTAVISTGCALVSMKIARVLL